MENFKTAFKFTIKWEGGDKYTNDPTDPGGETKYGISKRGHPDLDIKSLTEEEAEKIYYNEYWVANGCDKLPLQLAICVFDAAVNCGGTRAKRWLASIPETEAVRRKASLFNQRRIAYYNELVLKKPALNKYIKGWLNRVTDLGKYIDVISNL